jgi:hypothetical protein
MPAVVLMTSGITELELIDGLTSEKMAAHRNPLKTEHLSNRECLSPTAVFLVIRDPPSKLSWSVRVVLAKRASLHPI